MTKNITKCQKQYVEITNAKNIQKMSKTITNHSKTWTTMQQTYQTNDKHF